MKRTTLLLFTIAIINSFLAIGISLCNRANKEKTNKEKVEFEMVCDTSQLTYLDLNQENFYLACELLGVHHPDIVYAQALLESGRFESRLFKECSNMLGLYNARKDEFFSFEHWTDCLIAYRDMVQYKYTDGDYYDFLRDLPYAEDAKYIHKIKWLVNNEVTPRRGT